MHHVLWRGRGQGARAGRLGKQVVGGQVVKRGPTGVSGGQERRMGERGKGVRTRRIGGGRRRTQDKQGEEGGGEPKMEVG